MSFIKNVGLIILLYCFALLQSSFLIHLGFFKFINLILISVFLINIFESPARKSGIFLAAYGGFLVDVFSSRPIGVNLVIYFSLALLIKYILKNHVRVPFDKSI